MTTGTFVAWFLAGRKPRQTWGLSWGGVAAWGAPGGGGGAVGGGGPGHPDTCPRAPRAQALGGERLPGGRHPDSGALSAAVSAPGPSPPPGRADNRPEQPNAR